jgi:predicted Zn-dependent protease
MTLPSSLCWNNHLRTRIGLLCLAPLLITASLAATQKQSRPLQNSDMARRAEFAREKGDAAAIRLYHQALIQNPAWQEGWWYYGSLLYDNNQYSKAANALRRLTRLNSQLGGAWALLGLSEYESHDFGHALEHLHRAKDVGVGDNESLANVTDYHLAIMLNARRQFEEARNLLSSLVLRGEHSEDVQVGLGMSLLRVPLLPSQLDPSRDALVHDAGNVGSFLAKRQYEKADAAFQLLLAKYPTTHFLHYAYGTMLASRGKDDLAEAEFQHEIVLTPDSALPYMAWAFLESRASDYREALPLAQKAVQLSDHSFLAHYLLGSAQLGTGNSAESISQLEIARRLAPESPEVRYTLARAYAKAGQATLARHEQAEFTKLNAKRQKKRQEGDEILGLSRNGDADSTPSTPVSE